MSSSRDTSAPRRILVVDDEPSIVDAVATSLRYEGYDVEEAMTGREAIAAVERREPDLIVLDWMLPDLEGIEVGRRLRAQGFKSAVLFLTAKDATENKVEALRAGGDDYVTKPFSLAEVVARIQAILRRTAGDLPGDVLRFADLMLDEQRHEVFRGWRSCSSSESARESREADPFGGAASRSSWCYEWPAATLSSDRLPALAAGRRGRRMRAVRARRRRRGGALMSKSSPSAPWPTPRPRPSRGSHGLPLPPFCRSPPMQAGEVERPV